VLLQPFEPIASRVGGDFVQRVVEIHPRIMILSISSATTPTSIRNCSSAAISCR
jgi:hypothetical protein